MALKLKQFDSSHQSSRVQSPTITVSPAGRIAISTLGLIESGLKIGDKIALFQDENEPQDWYFGKSADGIPLIDGKGQGFIQAKTIANEFLTSLDFDSTARFAFGESEQKVEKQKIYSILTRKPLSVRRKKN